MMPTMTKLMSSLNINIIEFNSAFTLRLKLYEVAVMKQSNSVSISYHIKKGIIVNQQNKISKFK